MDAMRAMVADHAGETCDLPPRIFSEAQASEHQLDLWWNFQQPKSLNLQTKALRS